MSGTQPEEPHSSNAAKFIRLDDEGRKFWVVHAPKLPDLAPVLATIPGPRTLLIHDANAEWDLPTARNLARTEITHGLRYLCAWSPKATLLEDVFDQVLVDLQLHHQRPDHPTLMTTSHNDEPWKSALWFFKNCAHEASGWPTPCEHRIVAVIGDQTLPTQIEALLVLNHWDA